MRVSNRKIAILRTTAHTLQVLAIELQSFSVSSPHFCSVVVVQKSSATWKARHHHNCAHGSIDMHRESAALPTSTRAANSRTRPKTAPPTLAACSTLRPAPFSLWFTACSCAPAAHYVTPGPAVSPIARIATSGHCLRPSWMTSQTLLLCWLRECCATGFHRGM